MKISIDKDSGAAYIYLVDQQKVTPGVSVRTVTADENVNIDYDKDGNLIGIEILALSILDLGNLKHLEYFEHKGD